MADRLASSASGAPHMQEVHTGTGDHSRDERVAPPLGHIRYDNNVRSRSSDPKNMSGSSLEYTRRLYDNVIEWYKNADTKAQVILTLDGAFLAFLTNSVFMDPDDLALITQRFTSDMWLLLSLMCLCLASSIVCALLCFWSRLYSRADATILIGQTGPPAPDTAPYSEHVMWFFQLIPYLDQAKFGRELQGIDEHFETAALASQIHKLAGNVSKKHYWANRAFLLAVFSLLFFLVFSARYVFTLAR
jgi:hypothetical protein